MNKERDKRRTGSKHRRAFSWSMSERGNPRAKINGFVRLGISDYPEILEDYQLISRRRTGNPTALALLQIHILHDLAVHEKAIKHYKSLFSDTQNNDFREEQTFMHGLTANALRIIGDGIAWRAFKFDRSVPRVLSRNEVQQVIVSDGLMAELNEWSASCFEAGTSPILNCITNCLALGDVTVVGPGETVEVVEVKAGKTKSRRKIRQKERMRGAVELLNGSGIVDGKSVQVKVMPLTPRNHLKQLGEMLAEASATGSSSAPVGSHLYVECVDISQSGRIGKTVAPLEFQASGEMADWDEGLTVSMCSLDILQFSPSIAPFSIYPFDDKTCVDLMIGRKFYTVHMNFKAVIAFLGQHGWSVEKGLHDSIDESDGWAALALRKGSFYCELPPGLFGSIQMEMLSLESVLEQIEHMKSFATSGDEGEYGYWLYENEATQWQ